MSPRSKFNIVSVILFLLIIFSVPLGKASNDFLVPVEISEAEEVLVFAYNAVLDAEKVGGNITGLLEKLNLGGEYLAEAYVYARLEVPQNAKHFASLCIQTVDEVEYDAVLLMEEALKSGDEEFLMRIVSSGFGIITTLVCSIVFWRIFKRRYVERLLELKPEVSESES